MSRHYGILRTAIACGVALCLVAATVSAQEQADESARAKEKETQSTKRSKQAVKMPAALRDLDLKQQQKKSIRQAIRKHDRELHQTWLQFHEQHARAVELEAAWLAAVRDTLSDDDQRAFDEKRMQHQKRSSDAGKHSARDHSASKKQRDDQATSKSSTNRHQAKSKDEGQTQEDRRAASDNEGQSGKGGQQAFGIVLIRMTSPQQFAQGLRQNASQQQQCSEVCREYQQALKTAWRDLHQLHLQLVEIEAEKMQAIENELTDEQVAALKNRRQSSESSRTETSTAKEQDTSKQ